MSAPVFHGRRHMVTVRSAGTTHKEARNRTILVATTLVPLVSLPRALCYRSGDDS